MTDAATCCCELKVMRGFRITSLIQQRKSGSAVAERTAAPEKGGCGLT